MTFAVAGGVALVSAVLQIILKAQSRPSVAQGAFWWKNVKRDDWVFWSDWVINGGVAAAGFILTEVLAHHVFDPLKLITTIAILLSVLLLGPSMIGAMLYEGDGKLKSNNLRIILADLIGLIILTGLVFGGAHYG